MPTLPQIETAKLLLDPQPYNATTSVLTADNAEILRVFLVKYLTEHHKSGRYTLLADKITAAVGVKAAILQAILTNVSGVGSKKAKLNGEVEYSTQEAIDNELALAISLLYAPISDASMGTMPSYVATAIRAEFARTGCGYGDEYQQTRCKDLT